MTEQQNKLFEIPLYRVTLAVCWQFSGSFSPETIELYEEDFQTSIGEITVGDIWEAAGNRWNEIHNNEPKMQLNCIALGLLDYEYLGPNEAWQPPKPVVEIEVLGGVASVVKCPDWIEVEIRDYDVEDEEEDEDWYFTMDGVDVEEFGPYDTELEALEGIRRIQEKGLELNDGVERTFTAPYQGKRDSVW